MKDLESFFLDKRTTAGQLVKAFRKNYRITQKELCSVIGINENNMSAIENDRREIGVHTAKKIAAFFGFDPSFLLFPSGHEDRETKRIRQKAEQFFRRRKREEIA